MIQTWNYFLVINSHEIFRLCLCTWMMELTVYDFKVRHFADVSVKLRCNRRNFVSQHTNITSNVDRVVI